MKNKIKKYLLVQKENNKELVNINSNNSIFLSPWDRYKSHSDWKNTETWITNENGNVCPIITNTNCMNGELIYGKLIEILNKVLGVEYKKRTWSALIYPWFWEVINYYDCLYGNIKGVKNKYEIICVLKSNKKNNIPKDSQDCNAMLYGGSLYANGVEHACKALGIKIIYKKGIEDSEINISHESAKGKIPIKFRLGIIIRKLILLAKKQRNNILLGVTYLPLKSDTYFRIIASGKNLMDIKVKKNITTNENNLEIRKKLLDEILVINISEENKQALDFIIKYMPVAYLEEMKLEKNNYEIIYSANNYWYDEEFKKISAAAIEFNNAKIIIGQHGANITTTNYYYIRPEYYYSDKMIAWGDYKRYNSASGFNFKRPYTTRRKKINKINKILIIFPVLDSRNHSLTHWAAFHQERLESVVFFINKLEEKYEVSIKLSLISTYNYGDEHNYLNKNIKRQYKIVSEVNSIKKEVELHDLIVHFYNSTGFLESISSNLNTIMIINKHEYKELLSEIKIHYKSMNKIKMLYFNIQEALDFLNKKNIIIKYLEEAHKSLEYNEFKNSHAKTVDNPELELLKIIN